MASGPDSGTARLRVIVVSVYLAATLLAGFCAVFLYFGINELGDDLGWWQGEPTLNDGPEIALLMGGVPIILIIAIAAAIVVAFARRIERPGWPAALIGSLWLVLVVVVIVWWVLADSLARTTYVP